MGLYIFQHPQTKEIKEVFQHMKEDHIFEQDGVRWDRIFTIPQTSIDTVIDPFSCQEFKDKTKSKKNLTLGQAWDISQELSEKREKKAGKDPIKEKVINDYSKKTHGKKHPLTKSKNNIFDLMKDMTKKK